MILSVPYLTHNIMNKSALDHKSALYKTIYRWIQNNFSFISTKHVNKFISDHEDLAASL